ncbi:amino acid ABC transporter permease [Glutamicibacter bergerei]|uniref:Amino acid ABC transporter permease n=1 Tax=Glutamicibacter bergerei TaxID=256702 RepID=A0ABV9MRC2_9MICC|nr:MULTISPECIES: amino acid ABC transporter permease [Micrococcaceae]PCC35144.1 amino acid ABC transporter permease [Glutamicibacter sp. BW77]PRB71590.1 amino acid ABC transporter permease [Arthrobacter sp. MYb213]HBV10986.1 amino acid ABC transporter permease [Micrococcaceae bacterium]
MDSLWQLALDSLWPMVSGALTATIPLAIISFVLGLAVALMVALMRISANKVVSGIARGYISIIRGTPLLVQLFVIFYGLPSLGVTIDPWPSAIIAFTLNVGGYAAEIIRAAILSVPGGQWEAGYTIGMSKTRTLYKLILPQAARVAIPPLSNTFISLVKDTSLASMILVTEMFRRAQEIAATTYEFMLLYMEAAAIYWVICLVLSAVQDRMESRLEKYVA